MTHAGPLPLPRPPVAVPALVGWWRGYVDALTPLAVSVPGFAGSGSSLGKVEAVPGLVLVVGARIWVTCIEGNRNDLLIVALRG